MRTVKRGLQCHLPHQVYPQYLFYESLEIKQQLVIYQQEHSNNNQHNQ